jgi:hypothetical protein
MRIRENPNHAVVVEGCLNALHFDKFWAFMKIAKLTESELIRESWRDKYDKMSEQDKKQITNYLQKNPSPRMIRENKQKCE